MSVKQSPHEEYDRGFSNGWDACAARAQPAQVGQVLTIDEIEEAFQQAADADDETHIRFARAIEQAVMAKRVPPDVVRDAERYRWLTDDHADYDTRTRIDQVAARLSIRGKGATDAMIDAAIAAGKGEGS